MRFIKKYNLPTPRQKSQLFHLYGNIPYSNTNTGEAIGIIYSKTLNFLEGRRFLCEKKILNGYIHKENFRKNRDIWLRLVFSISQQRWLACIPISLSLYLSSHLLFLSNIPGLYYIVLYIYQFIRNLSFHFLESKRI